MFKYLDCYFILTPNHGATQSRGLPRSTHCSYSPYSGEQEGDSCCIRGRRRELLAAAIAIPVAAAHNSKSRRCPLQLYPLHLLQQEWAQTFAQYHERCKMVRRDRCEELVNAGVDDKQTSIHGTPKSPIACLSPTITSSSFHKTLSGFLPSSVPKSQCKIRFSVAYFA